MDFLKKKFSEITDDDLSSFIKEVKANGYIGNIDFKDASYILSRMLEKAFEKEVSSIWHHGRGTEVYNTISDEKLEALYDYYNQSKYGKLFNQFPTRKALAPLKLR